MTTSVAISTELFTLLTKDLERVGGRIKHGEIRRRIERLILLGLAAESKTSKQVELPL